jgi:O-antigen ligase
MALTSDSHAAPVAMVAIALVPSVGILLGGFNSMFGNGLVALAYGSILAVLCLHAPPGLRFWRRSALALGLALAAVAWAAVSLVFGTPVAPDLGLSGLVGCLGMIAALLCGALLGFRRARLGDFSDAVVLFGVLGLIIGCVLLRGTEAPLVVWRGEFEGRFRGTLGNANASGAAYGAMAALALARALTTLTQGGRAVPRRLKAVGYGLLTVLFLGGLVITASRSGMVLAVLALGLVGVTAIARRNGAQVLLLVIPVAVAALAIGAGYGDVLYARFGHLPGEVVVREVIWRHNWAVARQALWLGYGVDAFPEINTRSLAGIRETQAIWMTNSPHTIVLRLIIDAGLPYLVMILASAIVIAAQVTQAARHRGIALDEVALIAAIAVILGSAMVDIALEVPALAALMFNCAGLLWGRSIAGHHVRIAAPRVHPDPAKVHIGG